MTLEPVPASSLAIATSGLRKEYGGQVALQNLSLEVRRGEVFGLLGPNGAGKSTCLKLLLGLARPTRGRGLLLDRPLGDVAARAKVGFLPEQFHFHDCLSGAELLRLHGRLYGMEPSILRRRVPQLLERVALAAQGAKPIHSYSKGMRQRLGLAQALLNEPELIFLDEPTSGLDPHGRLLVREVIREQRGRGATVFLNSHLLGEVEVSCDRVAFLKQGRVVDTRSLGVEAESLPLRLRANLAPEHLTLLRRFSQGAAPVPVAGETAAWTLQVAHAAVVPDLLRALVAAGADVFELTPVPPSLEDLFLRILGPEEGPG